MDRNTPIVPSDYIFAYTDGQKNLGFDFSVIFNRIGLDYEDYRSNPFPLSINQVTQLVSKTYDYLKMPYLGLATGQQMRLTAHGMAGVSAMAQPTYAQCLQVASRLCRKIFPALTMEYIETADTVGLRIIESVSLAPYSHYFIETIAVNFYNIMHFLLGDEYQPEYIAFAYPEPDYRHIYHRYFRCKISFNAEHNEFVVSRQLAQQELLLANAGIARMAEQGFLNALPSINLNYLPKRLRLLLVQSVGAFPSMDAAARKLGMSGRTLRRQLSSAGTSFQNELDLLRREFAINYLATGNKSITEIALMLGYCDTAAFSKAFKKWTGESPSEFKSSHVADGFRIMDGEDNSGPGEAGEMSGMPHYPVHQ